MEKINNIAESSNTKNVPVSITGLSHEGRGIAHINGKTSFVEDALPGESVLVEIVKKHRQYDEAKTTAVLKRSSDRVTPKCIRYGICGACSLQHLSTDAQLKHKEKTLLEQLAHIAGTQPNTLLSPLQASSWGYRRRARLGVKYVVKKQAVLVGFREKNGRYLAELKGCETLAPRIAQLIMPLRQLISTLKAYQSIPQIEASLGDEDLALVFRHLAPLDNEDHTKLKVFAKEHQLQLYLQPGNESTMHCIWPEIRPKSLSYRIDLAHQPSKPLELFFEPNHFIQINAAINQSMINRAIELLSPNFSDRILDLFCGLGNFSLPLATQCQSVIGIEGSPELVACARENAMHNTISNVQFYTADLSNPISEQSWSQQRFNKLLLDPPRSGALEIIQQISSWPIERIVYVSCNSASLARDAGELIKQGYTLEQAGVMDMFPHTQHSEAICLFTR
ncbi:23S rRNA (uracil(1939)-C(5))-methyltransferase RlmD [Rickettsiella endosymbiont of Dermanyssus gallinae]|uniref:23S rRNA (uracil(1939)-C(5))-methyltransferase RlmD n=1 Tax=Rickettsiella endosymbiont of Dermanyssus gallinae TaxID=2856608 RepID=UPI001C531434|nr:23S rRNA (uracil(1939)-C(5))-methyltransferase RlmD [Rickettsiella endosymbiont of Dermanyssus gallinae]